MAGADTTHVAAVRWEVFYISTIVRENASVARVRNQRGLRRHSSLLLGTEEELLEGGPSPPTSARHQEPPIGVNAS
jgi:hypothetical protein